MNSTFQAAITHLRDAASSRDAMESFWKMFLSIAHFNVAELIAARQTIVALKQISVNKDDNVIASIDAALATRARSLYVEAIHEKKHYRMSDMLAVAFDSNEYHRR